VVLGHHETPLSQAIRPANIFSNNFVAERIFQTVGAEVYGHPASSEKGQKAIHEMMRRYGVDRSQYVALNGSGLAHCNRITPAGLVTLLRRLYYDIEVAPDFLSSLSVGGVSGTTRRRFSGHPSAGLVRAKTGTLRSKSALSGYVGDKEDVLVFSILADGFGHRRQYQIRTAQAYLVDAMLRYARHGQAPTTQPGTLPVLPVAPEEEGAEGPDEMPVDDDETPIPPGPAT
jgi:D-alanyl-D-alanine carboxypeptidase